MKSTEFVKKYSNLKKSQIDELCALVKDTSQLFEIIGQLDTGTAFKDILADLQDNRTEFDSCVFDDALTQRNKDDDLLENPTEVQEGEMPCPKCGSKKTMVIEMQTRSGDEGFTYYIQCFEKNCNMTTKTN